MKVVSGYQDLPAEQKGAAVALGNFDGVHPGHEVVIGGALAYARTHDVPSGVIAFEPHTRQFFRPDDPPFRLTSVAAKTRVLTRLGVDVFYPLPFDNAMASLPAKEFVRDVLVGALGVRYVAIGADFKFGKMRKGDSDLLKRMGAELGFAVEVFDLLTGQASPTHDDDKTYSSTRVRAALREGDARHAAAYLGRLWSMDGVVQKGDQRGRTIGFPTMNIPMGGYIYPALWIYAVCVEVMDGPHQGLYQGVADLGKRPTFNKTDVLLEAYLFDFEGELYGAHVYVYFLDFIRPEYTFAGVEALTTQIAKDVDKARQIWAAEEAPTLIGG